MIVACLQHRTATAITGLDPHLTLHYIPRTAASSRTIDTNAKFSRKNEKNENTRLHDRTERAALARPNREGATPPLTAGERSEKAESANVKGCRLQNPLSWILDRLAERVSCFSIDLTHFSSCAMALFGHWVSEGPFEGLENLLDVVGEWIYDSCGFM